MNKKTLVVSMLTVFTLVAISFASAVNINAEKTTLKKANHHCLGYEPNGRLKRR